MEGRKSKGQDKTSNSIGVSIPSVLTKLLSDKTKLLPDTTQAVYLATAIHPVWLLADE